MQGRLCSFFDGDVGGLEPVLEEKLGFCIAVTSGMDHVADRAGEGAIALAEVEAVGLHS